MYCLPTTIHTYEYSEANKYLIYIFMYICKGLLSFQGSVERQIQYYNPFSRFVVAFIGDVIAIFPNNADSSKAIHIVWILVFFIYEDFKARSDSRRCNEIFVHFYLRGDITEEFLNNSNKFTHVTCFLPYGAGNQLKSK